MKHIKKIIAVILSIAVICPSFLPQMVYAASQSRAVGAERTYEYLAGAGTVYSYGGAGSLGDYRNLNSDDSDTSYGLCQMLVTPYVVNEGYSMVAFIEPYLSINSVTLYVKARRTAANGVNLIPLVRIAATNYGGGNNALSSAAYTISTKTWPTNPAGGAWTAAAINGAEWGWSSVSSPASAASYAYVTYMYIEVNYTALVVPDVTTAAATIVDVYRATLNGSITDNTSGALDHRGFAYDTISRAAPGNVAPAASGYSNYWTDNSTGFAPGVFDHITGGLAVGTDYYYRAFAHNAIGWAYGDEFTVQTIGVPTVAAVAASDVATTTARLNAQITDDGGEGCLIRYGYDTVTRANVAAYATVTAWSTDNFTTGEFPYRDILGLAPNTTYFFRSEISNKAGEDESGELTFTTYSGISAPTNLSTIPSSTSIAMSWVKGVGSNKTLVRYSTGTYPLTIADGTLLYFNTSSSVELSGLDPGVTIYISAWGENAGTYSAGHAMSIGTTLAYSPTEDDTVFDVPPNNTSWLLVPGTAMVNSIPLLSDIVLNVETEYAVPSSTLWYLIWITLGTGLGIIIYNRGGNNLPMSIMATCIFLGAGATMGLVMLAVMAVFGIAATGFILARRN